MKRMKKVIAAFLALMMVVFVIGTGVTKAARQGNSTNVHVVKLKADNYPNGAVNHDGTMKTMEQLGAQLGTTVQPLAGVKFKHYKVTDEAKFKDMVANPSNYDTAAKVEALAGQVETGIETAATGANGEVNVPLEDGNYWFIETEKPETVSSAVAVPFGISLPITNTDGTEELSDVYVYPKNVDSNLPEPEKTVGAVDNKTTNNYDIGKEFSWFLKTTVPQNIKDYVKLEFSDMLDSKLTYVGNVVVKYGNDVVDPSNYEITEPTDANREFKVTFKAADDGKLKYFKELTQEQIKQKENDKLVVEFKTKINNTAIMGSEIENGFDLKFRNNPNLDTDKTKTPTDKPKVVTGGKKFKKVDAITNAVLQGAEFVVKKETAGQITYLKQAADGTAEWVNTKEEAKKFTSGADGMFEVKGLAYSMAKVGNETVNNNYSLVEVKAPAGYALLTNEIAFTVDANSYSDQEATIQKVTNKKLTIPQTGGMGTVIFAIAGIAIMGGAVYAMRRKEQK